MPVYKVVISVIAETGGAVPQTRLIEAKNESRALAHVVLGHIELSRPSSAELVALGADGCKIEQAE